MANAKANATINNANINNALADKLKRKNDERTAEFRNAYIDENKTFISFPDFRKQLGDIVELACVTKLKKHVKDENGNNVTDELGEYMWEDLYAFIDARFPDNWSYGGSALRAIYKDLVDEETDETTINKWLAENPITFRLRNKKLENGKNKGKIMVEWLM